MVNHPNRSTQQRSPAYMAAYAEHVVTLRGPEGLYELEKAETESGVIFPSLTALRTKRKEIWSRINAAAVAAGQ